ncbi:MAG: hypothetical protein A4E55_00121 [Pelotomaculum sp. PtaU1.Bin035]|nr:MAG: hypothetical protein A4E55_00121 [Pelotomaculum sp. PtaU1.Bin035]
MNPESFKMLESFSKEELIKLVEDMAKRWLAHDGVWFQCFEFKSGMEEAMEMDALAWERFAVIEANRVMKLHNILPGGGIPALKKALKLRACDFLNESEIIDAGDNKMIYRIKTCRVQASRNRKNMQPFPCKSVGIKEFSNFAKTIDPNIQTRCVTCPPDEQPEGYICAWEFTYVKE